MITDSIRRQATNHGGSETRRALTARTRDVLAREIAFIPNPCFREFDAEKRWRQELATAEMVGTKAQTGRSNLPTHLQQMCACPLLTLKQERDLFCRMNYLKYRANSIRSTLNEHRPSVRKLEDIGRLLAKANETRNRIVHANTRLVVSIVKKFADPLNPFDDLLSEGVACLMNAVEKFDFDRGYRFSTYATMAVRRDVFRSITRSHLNRVRFATGATDILDQQVNAETREERTESGQRETDTALSRMLSRLDEREQFIVKARYGFLDIGMKPTYLKLGEKLGISKERVRQLELRAMNKLRDSIDELQSIEPVGLL